MGYVWQAAGGRAVRDRPVAWNISESTNRNRRRSSDIESTQAGSDDVEAQMAKDSRRRRKLEEEVKRIVARVIRRQGKESVEKTERGRVSAIRSSA